jgi:pseudouridine-5'-phosphate glycosidase
MIELAPDVAAALAEGSAVVALESTIIAHGLPSPQNLEIALELEETVRRNGAVPATIAVVDGVAKVGLTPSELERFAEPGADIAKAGTADLAAFIASKRCAATTVSATTLLAARAGIRVFATGGIGGVHRDDPADTSADLVAIARHPVAVVSAGPKAILDLRRTLEALESLGVLVIGFETDELPSFYCRESGLRLEHRFDSAAEVAEVLRVRFDGLGEGGVLVASPIPRQAALPREEIDSVIAAALAEAAQRTIHGKALTPFLLSAIAKQTDGRAVVANRSLAVHNAEVAASIAICYSELG